MAKLKGDQLPLDIEATLPLRDERPATRSVAWYQRHRFKLCPWPKAGGFSCSLTGKKACSSTSN
jgi:hypothetical protein